jgi:hypothetical protein
LRTAFSNATQITTYHLEYLLDSTQHRSITQANNLRVSFDNASLKEYFIATNIKGLVIPEIIRNNQGDEGFNSGYALVEVKVYHIGTSKLIESFDVLAYNDEEVSVRNRRNTNYGSSGNDYSISARDMLIVNLNTNIKSEVLEKLNLSTKRTLEEEVSSPPSADDLKDSKPSTSA